MTNRLNTNERTIVITALRHALPYLRVYKHKVFVLKAGGDAFVSAETTRALMEQIGILHQVGIRVVLVHGGGPQSTALSKRLGLATQMIEGRRVTDAQTLEVSTMVLNGEINTRIVAMCRALGIPAIDWLGDPHFAMPAIILFAVWKNFGYNMIILLAGLQNIPRDLYEAARIDGASSLAQFRYVTLPMLTPLLTIVGILTVAGYFQLFAEPYVMTQGGPLQSTVSVLYFMYEEGFKWWNLGSASAVAFLLFLLIFAVTAVQLGLSRWQGAP